MHDPSIGRFGAVDPLSEKYLYNSTFAFSENRLIDGFELEGLEYVLPYADKFQYNPYDDGQRLVLKWLGNVGVVTYNSFVGTWNYGARLDGAAIGSNSPWTARWNVFSQDAKAASDRLADYLIKEPGWAIKRDIKNTVFSVEFTENLGSAALTAWAGSALRPGGLKVPMGSRLATRYIDEAVDAATVARNVPTRYRAFTIDNYRHNLQVLTGQLGEGMDAHHIFPKGKQFDAFFQRAGINVHDPNNLTWWESGAHRAAAPDYTRDWSRFMQMNPDASPEVIRDFGASLMRDYGF
jgi:hypothetical protein